MDGEQPEPEDLAAREQVADVGAREVAAAVALAALLHRPLVEGVLRRLDRDVAAARDRGAVARDARGDDAVEHVHSARDALRHLAHHAEPHHVARAVLRQVRHARLDRAVHLLLRLADRDAAHGVAVEADLHQLLGAAAADVVVDPALHDAEDLLAVGARLPAAALRPADRARHRRLGARAVARIRQALVEDHRDVGAERALHRHRLLRPEEELVAVEVGVEAAALLGELAHPREREDLEAAGVGEDRAVPAHEAVEPAGSGDHLGTGAQQQVVGVAEHHLGAELHEVARLERLHRAERAHVHEHRRVHGPVRRLEPPQPRLRTRILLYDLEIHRCVFYQISRCRGKADGAPSSQEATPKFRLPPLLFSRKFCIILTIHLKESQRKP